MKITKKQLRQLISEEYDRAQKEMNESDLEEGLFDWMGSSSSKMKKELERETGEEGQEADKLHQQIETTKQISQKMRDLLISLSKFIKSGKMDTKMRELTKIGSRQTTPTNIAEQEIDPFSPIQSPRRTGKEKRYRPSSYGRNKDAEPSTFGTEKTSDSDSGDRWLESNSDAVLKGLFSTLLGMYEQLPKPEEIKSVGATKVYRPNIQQPSQIGIKGITKESIDSGELSKMISEELDKLMENK